MALGLRVDSLTIVRLYTLSALECRGTRPSNAAVCTCRRRVCEPGAEAAHGRVP